MTRSASFEIVAGIAEDQWGLITRRQAEAAGVPKTTLDRFTADGSVLERVARGVYRVSGSPVPDHLELRAAWLQLEPGVLAWARTIDQGVVSHRSAALVLGLGHLSPDVHEFTASTRRQPRRTDVRVYKRPLSSDEVVFVRGMPVTRSPRIVSDLLARHEDPEGVGQIIADSIRTGLEPPLAFVDPLRSRAVMFGLRRGDGVGLFRWLVELAEAKEAPAWISEARAAGGTAPSDRSRAAANGSKA